MRKIVCFHSPDEINGFLSNWYYSEFTDERGIVYTSMEKYMMYQKAVVFNDSETAAQILKMENVAEIKNMGRLVKNFNEYTWSRYKYNIVRCGVYLKFSQDSELLEKLLSFGDGCIFAECAVHDRVWGIGMSMRDPDRFNPEKWKGENLLGRAITHVREELAEEYG